MDKQISYWITTFASLGVYLFMYGTSAIAQQASSESDSRQDITYLDDRAWVNNVGTLLYSDPDLDSYFSGISLSIDADSSYFDYAVYATVDIIDDTGRSERLHTTRTFDIYGGSLGDEYHVDIDLISDFRPATYELQIALFDAYDDQLLDYVTARDFRNLSGLPLESEDNLGIFVQVVNRPVQPLNDGVLVVEYAGSGGVALILLLVISLGVRTRTHGN